MKIYLSNIVGDPVFIRANGRYFLHLLEVSLYIWTLSVELEPRKEPVGGSSAVDSVVEDSITADRW